MNKSITSFSGEYSWLSNFYPCRIVYEDYTYQSVEHAFQASKSVFDSDRYKISDSNLTAGQVKKLGRTFQLRPDWEEVKLRIMMELLLIKFAWGTDLAKKLLATDNAELVEGNHWHDYFWGICNNKGENKLGKMLMQVRNVLACMIP